MAWDGETTDLPQAVKQALLSVTASLAGLAYLWGSDLMAGLALLAAILILLATGAGVTWLERRSISPRITNYEL